MAPENAVWKEPPFADMRNQRQYGAKEKEIKEGLVGIAKEADRAHGAPNQR